MQFTNFIVLAAITVFGASAAPAPCNENGGPVVTTNCPASSTEYCCNGGSSLLGLECTLSSLLGNTCSQQTLCCVDVENCTQTDGSTVTVPITLNGLL